MGIWGGGTACQVMGIWGGGYCLSGEGISGVGALIVSWLDILGGATWKSHEGINLQKLIIGISYKLWHFMNWEYLHFLRVYNHLAWILHVYNQNILSRQSII